MVPADVCYAIDWKESYCSLALTRDIRGWLKLFDALSQNNSAEDRESASYVCGLRFLLSHFPQL